MNDALAERIAAALEQIALELIADPAREKPWMARNVPQGAAQPVQPLAMPPLVVNTPGTAGPFPPIGSQPPTWRCPVHGTWKEVPAGVSQRTGRTYRAFIACGESYCNEKPGTGPAPARAIPPSQQLP